MLIFWWVAHPNWFLSVHFFADGGGRKVNENKALTSKKARCALCFFILEDFRFCEVNQAINRRRVCKCVFASFRFTPYEKFEKCKICKVTVHQVGSNYCQPCAYKIGKKIFPWKTGIMHYGVSLLEIFDWLIGLLELSTLLCRNLRNVRQKDVGNQELQTIGRLSLTHTTSPTYSTFRTRFRLFSSRIFLVGTFVVGLVRVWSNAKRLLLVSEILDVSLLNLCTYVLLMEKRYGLEYTAKNVHVCTEKRNCTQQRERKEQKQTQIYR